MKQLLWIVAIVLGMASCQSNQNSTVKTDSAAAPKAVVKEKVPVDAEWTAFARYISGVHDDMNTELELNDVWKLHAAKTHTRWEELKKQFGEVISGWVKEKKYLNEKSPKTLFYPFAGGDFYYANLFYPNRDTIIMIGLEPCGSKFDKSTTTGGALNEYLNNLDQAMFYPHKLGFFRTLSMDKDFNRGYLNGTLHTFLFYLTREGNNIHYVESFDVDDNGLPTNVVAVGTERTKHSGIRIGYSTPGDEQVRELIYISQNVADAEMVKKPGFQKYFQQRGDIVSYFKAASYLLYNDYFSVVRNVVLNQSKVILQDDSGMPLKLMRESGFNVELLGEYTRTIGLFSNRFQSDMKDEYQATPPAKLPFTIGYNAEFGECNLQLATKK